MAALGTQARSTVRGERNPHVGFEDPLESRAWAVWFAVRNGKVRATKVKPSVGPAGVANAPDVTNVVGYRVEINLTTKMRDLWAEFGGLPKIEQNSFANEVRSFLRASGNMICVRQPGLGGGDHGQPEWWVRETWNDVSAVAVFKTMELTPRERRLTPQEVGEDRPPAPVTVTNGAVLKKPTTAELVAQQVTEDRAKVAQVVADADYPLYQSEIAERTGFTHEKTGRLLRSMLEEKKKRIFRRLETSAERPENRSGRFHMLYWKSVEIPIRDRELYRMDGSLIDRVLSLKAGQSMLTRIMSSGVRKEVQELIDSGLLVLVNEGTEDERVMIATDQPQTPKASPRGPVGPQQPPVVTGIVQPPPTAMTGVVQPSPEVRTYTGMEAIGKAITEIIEIEVQKRSSGLVQRVEEMSRRLSEEKQARARAETALIKARADLSDVRSTLRKLVEL